MGNVEWPRKSAEKSCGTRESLRYNISMQKQADVPERTPARVHLAYLDGLRGLAAPYVVAFHVLAYYFSHLSSIVTRLVTPLSFGSYAVGVFIVLSGFCLMLPVARSEDGLLRGGAKRFFLSRARRILPPYYFAVALSLLLITFFIGHKTGTPWDTSVPVTKIGLVSHLLMLQDISTATWAQIDSPLWSVSVEWRIYFCFPLLVLAWRRYGPWGTTAAAFICAYILVLAFWRVHFLFRFNSQQNGITPQYLGLFALGMLAAGIAFSKHPQLSLLRRRLPWGWLTAGMFLALIAVTASHPAFLKGRPGLDFFVGLFASCLLIAASREGGWQKALSWKPLVVVGSFAYSLYLIHFPILQMVWQYLIHPLHLGVSASLLLHWLLGIPISVGVAYGFHLAFERPFMSKPGKPAVRTEREAEAAAIESPAP